MDNREIANLISDRVYGRAPRFRYFQGDSGRLYFWTTERFEDQYGSGVMRPVGKGSRSGKPEEWELDPDTLSAHALRKDAKARALRLYQAD